MPYVLPQPQPRQTAWDMLGFAGGTAADLLLKALLGGQISKIPQAGQQNGTQFPMSTSNAPAQSQGFKIPFTNMQINPNLDNQVKQSQLQQNQAYTQYLQGLSGTPSSGQGGRMSPEVAKYLAKKALEGDAEADAALQAAGY